ncbi:hypothetical protein [Pedobacter gandavensis]|nr:hypothetical protein [Pedobacter gandavensis]
MKYTQPQIEIETHRLILIPVSAKYKADIFAEFTPEINSATHSGS